MKILVPSDSVSYSLQVDASSEDEFYHICEPVHNMTGSYDVDVDMTTEDIKKIERLNRL